MLHDSRGEPAAAETYQRDLIGFNNGRLVKNKAQLQMQSLAEIEETPEVRLERLGKQRPQVFHSQWAEIGFIFSISMSLVVTEYFVSGFTVILPTLARDLNIPSTSLTWPACAFSLTVASFLLIFGRLSDIYGGFPVYVSGFLWITAWSLVAGFSINEIMLNVCRALQGLGPAAFLPSSVMVLGTIYRPGPRKNVVFSIFGACGPVGFFLGIFFAGITAEYASWAWYFWVGAVLSAITALTAYLTIPSDIQEKRDATTKVQMDWYGAILIVFGLIPLAFAIIDSSHARNRWQTPYIYIIFIFGSLFILTAIYVEIYVSAQPLLPSSLFLVPCMPALVLALFFTYGSFGVFLLYTTFYMENMMGASPLQVVTWYIPMALGGCIISTFGGFVLHLLPGTVFITISGISWIMAPLLFAIAPQGAIYWAYTFPAMICATTGIDVTFNIANIFITTSLPQRQQGLAGAIIMLLFHLSIAICLGLADIVSAYTVESLSLRSSYHAVFWLEVAFAAVALVILAGFVKITEAKSGWTTDELEAASVEGGSSEAN